MGGCVENNTAPLGVENKAGRQFFSMGRTNTVNGHDPPTKTDSVEKREKQCDRERER